MAKRKGRGRSTGQLATSAHQFYVSANGKRKGKRKR